MYPSLVSCTTAIWLLPWPAEALTEVALKFLTEGHLENSSHDLEWQNTFFCGDDMWWLGEWCRCCSTHMTGEIHGNPRYTWLLWLISHTCLLEGDKSMWIAQYFSKLNWGLSYLSPSSPGNPCGNHSVPKQPFLVKKHPSSWLAESFGYSHHVKRAIKDRENEWR